MSCCHVHRHCFYFNVLSFCTSLISIHVVAGAVASLELEQCAYEDKDIVRSPEPIPIQRSCMGGLVDQSLLIFMTS